MSKDEKIVLLERFLKAVVGEPDAEIEYRNPLEGYGEIWVDCDIDDVIKNISSLEMDDINVWFFPEGKMEKLPWDKKSRLRGTTKLQIQFEPKYWKQVEELKKELKELKVKKNESPKVQT